MSKIRKWGNHEPRTKTDIIFDTFNMILVIIVIAVCAYPIYYTVIASFSDPNAVITGKVFIWPVRFTLDSYEAVLNYSSIWVGYKNTIFYTIVGTLYDLFLLLPASYALSRRNLKGKGILLIYFIFTMYFSGGTIPYYMLIKNLNLVDTRYVMFVPAAFSIFNMIITKTYFEGFSESLREAAKIDGAGELRIFVQIVLPLSGAIISVMALYCSVELWNNYFSALLFLNDSSKFPLQTVLRQVLLMNSEISTMTQGLTTEALNDILRRQRMAETMKYSLIIIANLPVLVAYPFVQKYFVKGVMIGSVKG